MDTFSHAFWGRGLFGYRGHPWLALFFGAAPDLFSFGLFMFVQIITLQFSLEPGPPSLGSLPWWVFVNYDLMHSFISAFTAIGIISLYRKDLAFAMLGWPFHIVLDFPFHTREFFPTKIFWPFSDFTIDGISWAQPEVWFPNLAGLIILYFYRRGKKQGKLEK